MIEFYNLVTDPALPVLLGPQPPAIRRRWVAPPAVRHIARWAHGCTGPFDVRWDDMFAIHDVMG
jgi:hypothetical protein